MLAILVSACFLTNRHTAHHEATEASIFTSAYMHVIPSPIVAASSGHDEHAVDEHAGDDHAADAHGSAPLVSIQLPAALAFFDGDPDEEGA